MIDLPFSHTASVVIACLVLLLAICGVLYRGALIAGLGRRSATLLAGIAALAQAGWLAATAVLASMHLYSFEPGETIPWIGVGLAVPLVLGVLAQRLRPVAASLGAAGTPALLAATQFFRIEGFAFLALLAMDRLPPAFALPAGIGDVLVGLLAPLVAYALWKRPQRRALGVAFNILGMADLMVAVSLGVLLAPGPLQTIITQPTTQIMLLLPMALIPTFAVPLAIVLHIASLRLLRHTTGSSRSLQGQLAPV
jgi:hypothetical protein